MAELGIVGRQSQRAFIFLLGLFVVSLNSIDISQIDMRVRIFSIELEAALELCLRLQIALLVIVDQP